MANLLDASRLQAGALSVTAEPVALDEVVGAAVLGVPGADERVEVDVPEDLPLVQADPGCSSGCSSTSSTMRCATAAAATGRRSPRAAGAESAKLEVVDHGPGVTAEQRERLFEPFQRLDDRGTASGVGLGLSVARGFVEAMGGALVADAITGRRADDAHRASRSRRTAPRRPAVMTRVLVVDDEPGLRRALGINLRARDYEVDAAPDGGGRARRPPRASRPTRSCSTSGCPTWTAPR